MTNETPWFYCFMHWLTEAPLRMRLWLADWVLGLEPSTPADRIREQQHESLRRLFPGETPVRKNCGGR